MGVEPPGPLGTSALSTIHVYLVDQHTAASSEQALSLYRAAPSFSYWDPEVLATFIKYGLTETPTGVKLKTPVLLVRLVNIDAGSHQSADLPFDRSPTAILIFQEASTFVERQNGAHIYEMLADLNPDIELRFIYSGRGSTGCVPHIHTTRPVVSVKLIHSSLFLEPEAKISTQHTAWRRPVNSSNILMPVSHLMVQESPSAVGAFYSPVALSLILEC